MPPPIAPEKAFAFPVAVSVESDPSDLFPELLFRNCLNYKKDNPACQLLIDTTVSLFFPQFLKKNREKPVINMPGTPTG